MAELLLELYSEEIPPQLQIAARNQLKQFFEKFFEDESIKYQEMSIYSSPTRLTLAVKDLAEKIKFDKISDEKTSILNEPNYTNIIKSAVSNSDAIVKGSKQIPDEIDEEIIKNDIPALSFQEEDSFESYLNFYEELISEE